jgi:hypothetical protein
MPGSSPICTGPLDRLECEFSQLPVVLTGQGDVFSAGIGFQSGPEVAGLTSTAGSRFRRAGVGRLLVRPVESGDRARSADGSEIAGYVDIGR